MSPANACILGIDHLDLRKKIKVANPSYMISRIGPSKKVCILGAFAVGKISLIKDPGLTERDGEVGFPPCLRATVGGVDQQEIDDIHEAIA